MKLYVGSLRQGSGATLLIQVSSRLPPYSYIWRRGLGDSSRRLPSDGHSKKCPGEHQTPPCSVLCIVLASAEVKEKVCREQQLSALSTLVWL